MILSNNSEQGSLGIASSIYLFLHSNKTYLQEEKQDYSFSRVRGPYIFMVLEIDLKELGPNLDAYIRTQHKGFNRHMVSKNMVKDREKINKFIF